MPARLLTAAQSLRGFNRPSNSEHKSAMSYIWNERPVYETERQFIRHREVRSNVPKTRHEYLLAMQIAQPGSY